MSRTTTLRRPAAVRRLPSSQLPQNNIPRECKLSSREATMFCMILRVTPSLAARWLERHKNPGNRALRQSKLRKLIRAIQNDDFVLTPQGIAFDTNGMVIDGHHRLYAIVAANKAVVLVVWFNCPPGSVQIIDTDISFRDVRDAWNYVNPGDKMTVAEKAALKRVLNPTLGYNHFTTGDELMFARSHLPQIRRVIAMFDGKGTRYDFSLAVVHAVLIRALICGYSVAKLSRFVDLLCTGEVSNRPEDRGVRILHDYIKSLGPERECKEERRKLYWVVEAHLENFLNDFPIRNISMANSEVFPIEEDRRKEEAQVA